MTLRQVLKLQVVYVFAGIAYNIASWLHLTYQGSTLSPTNPLMGILALLIYAVFLLSGYFRKLLLYRILMGVAVLVFGYGGIVIHIIGLIFHSEDYYSIGAGLLAILINTFGFILNLYAVLKVEMD